MLDRTGADIGSEAGRDSPETSVPSTTNDVKVRDEREEATPYDRQRRSTHLNATTGRRILSTDDGGLRASPTKNVTDNRCSDLHENTTNLSRRLQHGFAQKYDKSEQPRTPDVPYGQTTQELEITKESVCGTLYTLDVKSH